MVLSNFDDIVFHFFQLLPFSQVTCRHTSPRICVIALSFLSHFIGFTGTDNSESVFDKKAVGMLKVSTRQEYRWWCYQKLL